MSRRRSLPGGGLRVWLIRPTGWILVDGRHEKIRAGMRVSAEIKTGDRRVIEYLLSPVMQVVKEAGRER